MATVEKATNKSNMCRSWKIVFLFVAVLHTPIKCIEEQNRGGMPIARRSAVDTNNIYSSRTHSQHVSLAEVPECEDDVRRLCGPNIVTRSNNFAVLDCLQSERRPEDSGLSDTCNNFLWDYKKNLTSDSRFTNAAKTVCTFDIPRLTDCDENSKQPGFFLACLIDHKDNITNVQCKKFLTKMEGIVFSDFRLIYKFVDKCKEDIEKLTCGRLIEDKKSHSQGETIECLQKNTNNLHDDCRHEIFRISELQADDFNLDRALYYACREDREKFCKKVPAGEGRVYKCLTQHKMDREMSDECHEKLIQRQKLIAQDYKVAKGLSKACREDIKEYKCRENTSKNREIRLSQILICLENALHSDKMVSKDCQAEMLEHRRSVLEDYQISPDLVNACDDDIYRLCGDKIEGNGKTIHCLMEHAKPRKRKKNRISQQCMREVEKLVRETDIAEDWRVDPILKEACQPVVDVSCKGIQAGEGRVLSCLMEKIATDHMTDECEEKLLQIQYFVSRDFRLDSKLYRACRRNAIDLCSASEQWAEDFDRIGPDRGPLLPCLFRYAYHPNNNMKLSSSCLQEVHRVMRQRAISVNLHPEIVEPCLENLAHLCPTQSGKGEELVCLQDNMEKLNTNCREVVANYTEEEAEHAELNAILYRACEPVAKHYCEDILKKDVDEGDLMQCLLRHRNDHETRMNSKCKAAVDHFQLISLKNYRFSFKFKEACKKEVIKYCKGSQTKSEVIRCLSSMVKNDTLLDQPPRVGRQCRDQLRVELLQRNEDINLDIFLLQACKVEREKLCKKFSPDDGMVLECLKNYRRQLSPECFRKLFNREQEEMIDNSIDFVLTSVCNRMINEYCSKTDISDVLSCLKDHKDMLGFDSKCRNIVLRRMVQQNSDYRLNPHIYKWCLKDVNKYCKNILKKEPQNVAFEGKVIDCLKDRFYMNDLSMQCKLEIGSIIKEAQLDVRQDPVLSVVCKEDIDTLCNEDDDGKGKIEECLKRKLQAKALTNILCQKQVAKLIQQTKADVQVDPYFYNTCAEDLNRFCHDIPSRLGKKFICLLDILRTSEGQLDSNCKEMLIIRKRMIESANQVIGIETVEQLVAQVSASPARNYFLVLMFAAVGMVFFGGLFCGRVTKRIRAESKNK